MVTIYQSLSVPVVGLNVILLGGCRRCKLNLGQSEVGRNTLTKHEAFLVSSREDTIPTVIPAQAGIQSGYNIYRPVGSWVIP
jgi:hypothetical protein